MMLVSVLDDNVGRSVYCNRIFNQLTVDTADCVAIFGFNSLQQKKLAVGARTRRAATSPLFVTMAAFCVLVVHL